MPKRNDIKSILVIGAGPIIIGQACEFDYSGTQGIKALKEEGYRVILINSNPATIMTDPNVADVVYIEPITPYFIEEIIKKEKPDAILPTLGGQTALNAALALKELGILEKYKIHLIGASINAIETAGSRSAFKTAMEEIGLRCPQGVVVKDYSIAIRYWITYIKNLSSKDVKTALTEFLNNTKVKLSDGYNEQIIEECINQKPIIENGFLRNGLLPIDCISKLKEQNQIHNYNGGIENISGISDEEYDEIENLQNYLKSGKGFQYTQGEFITIPAIIRPSQTLGGTGGGVANNLFEFVRLVKSGLLASPITEVQIDQSLIGWKEYEMEVIRDKADNAIIVCSIENIDPMGVHTGDSITVAPAITLSDKEYQKMRNASLAVLRKVGVETGGSNVQFAINPKNGEMVVIEMNPRVSRSSALASKATGFPIAKVAAKLAVGYTLDELKNDIASTFPKEFDYIEYKKALEWFEVDGCYARPLEQGDYDNLLELNRENYGNIFTPNLDGKTVEELTSDEVERYLELQKDGFYMFVICDKKTNEFVGQVNFKPTNGCNSYYKTGDVDFGYAILKKFQNKGITTEIAKAVVNFSFSRTNKMIATANPKNIASRRVLEKCGFRYIGDKEITDYTDSSQTVVKFKQVWSVYEISKPVACLETNEYYARPVQEGDFENWVKLGYENQGNPHTPQYCKNIEESVREQMNRCFVDAANGFYQFMIFERGTGEFVGFVNFRPYQDSLHYGKDGYDIGWAILKKFQNKGIATEFGKLVLNFAFKNTNIKQIQGTARPDNIPSCRIFEKIGMKFVTDYTDLDDKKTIWRLYRLHSEDLDRGASPLSGEVADERLTVGLDIVDLDSVKIVAKKAHGLAPLFKSQEDLKIHCPFFANAKIFNYIYSELQKGVTLFELNQQTLPASFEPAIDYIVVKIPKFNFQKFGIQNPELGTQMHSVGEVMSIGRSFEEALMKGLHSLEEDLSLFENTDKEKIQELLKTRHPQKILLIFRACELNISVATIAELSGYDPWFIERIKYITDLKEKLSKITTIENLTPDFLIELKQAGLRDAHIRETMGIPPAPNGKHILGDFRRTHNILPSFKRIDSCANEFATQTNYFYSTYEKNTKHDCNPLEGKKVIIIGSASNRIGQGIEFDYACVQGAIALKEIGIKCIMINCNPETVSTDFDMSDRLYFEPITAEHVMEIINFEKQSGQLLGVIIQLGGQTPLKLRSTLKAAGITILGMEEDAISICDDRGRFEELCKEIAPYKPKQTLIQVLSQIAINFFKVRRELYHIINSVAKSYKCELHKVKSDENSIVFEIKHFRNKKGFLEECQIIAKKFSLRFFEKDNTVFLSNTDFLRPQSTFARVSKDLEVVAKDFNYKFIVRPSSDVVGIGGRAIAIINNQDEFENYLKKEGMKNSDIEFKFTVDKLLDNAIELDVDAIRDKDGEVFICGILEHIEYAGIHSGDSACTFPVRTISQEMEDRISLIVCKFAKKLSLCGLINIQFAIKDGEIFVIEVNPRASRTVPFTSKAVGVSIPKIATKVMCNHTLKEIPDFKTDKIFKHKNGYYSFVRPNFFSVKEAVFSFEKFLTSDIILGPEMKSTGEVMGRAKTFEEAYKKAIIATGQKVKVGNSIAFLSVKNEDKNEIFIKIAKNLQNASFEIFATKGTAKFLQKHNINAKEVSKISEDGNGITDLIKKDQVGFCLNTTSGSTSLEDSFAIRRQVISNKVPYCTTIEAADVFATSITATENLF